MQNRTATITYCNRRIDKYSRASKETTVPAIKLSGNWLAQLDFNIGDKIELVVDTTNKTITISKGE
jgi:hypothetical protein